jgi:hypothetical protein
MQKEYWDGMAKNRTRRRGKVSEMGLQIWFREDIENSLLAVYTVMQATAATTSGNNAHSADYCRGFEDALKCVAMSFGVKLLSQGIVPEATQSPSSDH